jgi:hypothetical protein
MCGPHSVEGNGSTVYIYGANVSHGSTNTGRKQLALGAGRSLLASQCVSFTQISPGGILPIAANTWVYAAPADCPTSCFICQSGCLFCSVCHAAVSVRT